LGADPLDVVLICIAGAALLVFVVRGDRRIRLAALVAVGLAAGYLLFAGVNRWSVFVVRYQIPLYVAWSPVIAIGLARGSKWILRLAMAALLIACLPQLLNNVQRPLIHQSHGPDPLTPYFLNTNLKYIASSATDYDTTSLVISQTRCSHLGLGNWIVVEYPFWVGLQHHGWSGQIQDVGVQNVTSRFEDPLFRPCAVLTQQTPSYASASDSNVHLQFGQLALSIEPRFAGSIQVPIAGFSSHLSGVSVLPGSGWSFDRTASLGRSGTIFVYSTRSRSLALRFYGPMARDVIGAVASSPAGSFPRGTTNASGMVRIRVRAGVTQVDLGPSAQGSGALNLSGVVATK
jgi:hypothetical protein